MPFRWLAALAAKMYDDAVFTDEPCKIIDSRDFPRAEVVPHGED